MNAFERGLLRYIPARQLARIRSVRVGVAGAGGLGSNCAALLVRCGFKRLLLADFDAVEASNLNRQFFFSDQIGKPKVDALAENLRRINLDLHLECLRGKIETMQIKERFAGCDVVVEALDRAEDKAALVAALSAAEIFVVAASGIAGCGGKPLQTKRLGDRCRIVGDFVSDCGEHPPLAPRVMQAAAIQADLVLAYVLQRGTAGLLAAGKHASASLLLP